MGEVHVVEAGLLTTIQDARGRPGLGRFGIAAGGAMDPDAARFANRLVGTNPDAAVLEITLSGPTLSWPTGGHVGLAGADLGAEADGRRLASGRSHRLPAGAILRFAGRGAGGGARTYLAIEGGFSIEAVLGSASTDRRSGFGGMKGRELRPADVLRFAERQSGPLRSEVRSLAARVDPPAAVWVIPTPASLGWFAASALRTLFATPWTVAPESDRSGIRLAGNLLAARAESIGSVGVPFRSIQVPPGGEPIITMVDGPVTGGYPVIGIIPRLHQHRLAQAGPGTILRFTRTSVREVRFAERQVAVADVSFDEGEFAAGWAR